MAEATNVFFTLEFINMHGMQNTKINPTRAAALFLPEDKPHVPLPLGGILPLDSHLASEVLRNLVVPEHDYKWRLEQDLKDRNQRPSISGRLDIVGVRRISSKSHAAGGGGDERALRLACQNTYTYTASRRTLT